MAHTHGAARPCVPAITPFQGFTPMTGICNNGFRDVRLPQAVGLG